MLELTFSSILGFGLLLGCDDIKVRYAGTFLAAAGIYPNVSQTVAWNGNNIGGSTKRAVGIAMQVGFGNLGGVLSGFTYTNKDKPHYHRGHAIIIGLLAMSTILCAWMRGWCIAENKERDILDAANGRAGPNGWDKEEMRSQSHKGDDAGFFRFTT